MRWKKKGGTKNAAENSSTRASNDYRAMSDIVNVKKGMAKGISTRSSTNNTSAASPTRTSDTRTSAIRASSTQVSTTPASSTPIIDNVGSTKKFSKSPETNPENIFRLNSLVTDDYSILSNDINDDDSQYWCSHSVSKTSTSFSNTPALENIENREKQPVARLSSVLTDATGLNSVPDDNTILSNNINDDDSQYWGSRGAAPDKKSSRSPNIPATANIENCAKQPIERLSSVLTDATDLVSVPEETALKDFDTVSALGDENSLSIRSRHGKAKRKAMPEVKAVLISIIDMIQLRRYAETGPLWIGGLCFVGGISMSISAALDILRKYRNDDEGPTLQYMIFATYCWLFGVFITILEGRPFQIQIMSIHLWVSDYLKILRFEYGRGLLYIFAASLQYFTLMSPYTKITGMFMLFMGLITFLIGAAAKVSLDNARAQNKADHSSIKLAFDFYDVDNDGFLDVGGFQDFVISLGLNELENISYDTAFHAIDKDKDGKISWIELERWWSVIDYRNQTNILDYKVGSHYNINV